MTKKLYEENVYLKEAVCKVIERIEEKDKKIIVLDQTIFFPEGGGQKCDLGKIDSCNIIHVSIKDSIVYHQVDSFPESDNVICSLDWERRFDQMQQHCGEHILSGVFLKHLGLHNKGFHLGDDYVTVDIDTQEISNDQMDQIELLTNQAIWENHPIDINTVMTTEEANQYPLRKIPDINEDIRIVQINTVDTVACCGTHPSFSGEVGIVKILKWQKYKGMTRVFFKCGTRAFCDYQEKHQLINQLNVKYSADLATLIEKVELDIQKKKQALDELSGLRKQISEIEAIRLMEEADRKIVTYLYDDASNELIQLVGNNINKRSEGYLSIIGSTKEGTMIISHDGNVEIDCGKLVRENLKEKSAKGGGSKTRAQVTFSDTSIMASFLKSLKVNIDL